MKRTSAFVSISAISALLLTPTSARAEDAPFRKTLVAQSISSGVGRASLPLLQRQPGPGRAPVAQLLQSKFCQGRCRTRETSQRLRVTSAGWELQIDGDGTKGSYRHFSQMAEAQRRGVPVERRLGLDALERLGRTFIAENMHGVVVLQDGEALVPVKSVYELRGGQSLAGGAPSKEVVAGTIVFMRTIDGVAVVGGGSKVAVTFANDGAALSFDFDWPQYRRTGDEQIVASVPKLLERVQTIAALHRPNPTTTAAGPYAVAPLETISALPAALLPDSLLEKLECGYFDGGERRRDPAAPIQAGCFAHVVQQTQSLEGQGTFSSGYAGAVPAGVDATGDLGWAELSMLGLSRRPADGPQAPPAPSHRR
jgi:hypothetical protein